jgi:hypothetical protein
MSDSSDDDPFIEDSADAESDKQDIDGIKKPKPKKQQNSKV